MRREKKKLPRYRPSLRTPPCEKHVLEVRTVDISSLRIGPETLTPDPKPDDVDFHEETTDPLVADLRNFYKVEKWTRKGTKVDSLLYAGNSLGRARSVFEQAINHRPRIRRTIRQRTRVLQEWPRQ
jgi:hypothetical protein